MSADDPDSRMETAEEFGRGKRRRKSTERKKQAGKYSATTLAIVLTLHSTDEDAKRTRKIREKRVVSNAIEAEIASQPPLANDNNNFTYGPADDYIAPTITGSKFVFFGFARAFT
jgi:hypothetical protein